MAEVGGEAHTSHDANFDANAGDCRRPTATTGSNRGGLNPSCEHAARRRCTEPCGLKIRFGGPRVRVRVPPAPPRNPHNTPSHRAVVLCISASMADSWLGGATNYNGMVRHGINPDLKDC